MMDNVEVMWYLFQVREQKMFITDIHAPHWSVLTDGIEVYVHSKLLLELVDPDVLDDVGKVVQDPGGAIEVAD